MAGTDAVDHIDAVDLLHDAEPHPVHHPVFTAGAGAAVSWDELADARAALALEARHRRGARAKDQRNAGARLDLIQRRIGVNQRPGVRRVLCNNPSPFTFTGTVTYIVGKGNVAIIDPGPDDEAHAKALLDAVRAIAQGPLRDAADSVDLPDAKAARSAAFCLTAAEGGTLHMDNLRRRPGDFDHATRDRLIAGALQPAAVVAKAQRLRRHFLQQALALLDRYDVLLAPATPFAAQPIGQSHIDLGGERVLIRAVAGMFAQPISFIGLPVLTVPSISELQSGAARIERIRAVEPEDLLGRDPVQLDAAASSAPGAVFVWASLRTGHVLRLRFDAEQDHRHKGFAGIAGNKHCRIVADRRCEFSERQRECAEPAKLRRQLARFLQLHALGFGQRHDVLVSVGGLDVQGRSPVSEEHYIPMILDAICRFLPKQVEFRPL